MRTICPPARTGGAGHRVPPPARRKGAPAPARAELPPTRSPGARPGKWVAALAPDAGPRSKLRRSPISRARRNLRERRATPISSGMASSATFAAPAKMTVVTMVEIAWGRTAALTCARRDSRSLLRCRSARFAVALRLPAMKERRAQPPQRLRSTFQNRWAAQEAIVELPASPSCSSCRASTVSVMGDETHSLTSAKGSNDSHVW